MFRLKRYAHTMLAWMVIVCFLPRATAQAQDDRPLRERDPRQIVDETWLDTQAAVSLEQSAASERPDGAASLAGRLVFQSARDGNWEIYSSGDSGGPWTRLTNDPAPDIAPRLSPDGRQVVFASRRTGNYELFLMNFDGTGLRQLTNHPAVDSNPAWAPDGGRIAFASDRDGNPEVYVVSLDGTGVTRLTNAPGYDDEPAWSPDGRQIAFTSRRSAGEGDYFIWIMNIDGSGVRQVTNTAYSQNPVWWPDGRRLIFDASDAGGWQRPFIVNADGSTLAALGAWYPLPYFDLLMSDVGNNSSSAFMTLVTYQPQGDRLAVTGIDVSRVDWVAGSLRYVYGPGSFTAAPDFEITDRVAPLSRVLGIEPPSYSGGGMTMRILFLDDGPRDRGRYELATRIPGQGTWALQAGAPIDIGGGLGTIIEVGFAHNQGSAVGVFPLEVRVRATDAAGNSEPWPANDQASFRFALYSRIISGQVRDSLGTPIEGAVVTVANAVEGPVLTDWQGFYSARVWSPSGNVEIQVKAPGASQVIGYAPPVGNNVSAVDFVIPDAFDLARNGALSGPLPPTDWSLTGQMPLSRLPPMAPGAGGQIQSSDWLTLGWVSRAEVLKPAAGTPAPGMRLQVEYTTQGRWIFEQSDLGATVTLCPYQQPCQAPVQLSPLPFSRATLGPDGAWYVLVGSRPSDGYTLIRYLPGDTPVPWGPRTNWQGGGPFEELLFDAAGRLHWLWVEPSGGLHHAVRETTGEWAGGSGNLLEASTLAADALVDGSGRVQVVSCHPLGVIQRTWTPGSGWADGLLFHTQPCANAPVVSLTRADDDRLAVTWSVSDAQRVASLAATTGAQWQTQAVNGLTGPCTIGVQPAGYGAWQCFSQTLPSNLMLTPFSLTAGGGSPLYVGDFVRETSFVSKLVVGGYGASRNEIVIGSGSHFLSVNVAAQTSGAGGISQRIDLRQVVGQPLLSFRYALLPSRVIAGDSFAVHLVPTGSPTATVIPIEPAVQHRQVSIDLTPWRSQEIQLSFVITDSVNSGTILAQLWEAHVIDVRTPAIQAVQADGQSLTVTGVNFQQGVTALVGGVVAADVTRNSSSQLTVTIPSGLSPGRHAVQILNPDGTQASRPLAYTIGQLVFLPTIRNWADPMR